MEKVETSSFSWEGIGLGGEVERDLILSISPVILCIQDGEGGKPGSKMIVRLPFDEKDILFSKAMEMFQGNERLSKRAVVMHLGYNFAQSIPLKFDRFALVLDTYFKALPSEQADDFIKSGKSVRDISPDEAYLLTLFTLAGSEYTVCVPYDREGGSIKMRESDTQHFAGGKYDIGENVGIGGDESFDRLFVQGYMDGLAKKVLG